MLYFIKFLYEFIAKYKCRIKNIDNKKVRAIELKTALICYAIFFTSTTLYYHCLSKTTLSSTIILGNTSSVFVFIFSLCVLKEKFSIIKLIAMIFCAGGVATIAYSDNESSEGKEHIFGDILGILGALLLGLYSTLLAKLVPIEYEEQISFFNILGFIGTFCFITFWPLLITFHFAGIESLMLPKGNALVSISVNIVFGTLLYDYCWARATILLGPLLANTSVIFVVPISMIVDSFFQKVNFNWMYYLGTAGIVAGFFMIALKNYRDSILISKINMSDEYNLKLMNESESKIQSFNSSN